MKQNDILPGGRLTTDNPTNNTQTMLNYAYAKDGRVLLRYGDGEEDIDLCEYISREAADKHCAPTPKDVMEGACFECDCPLAILYVVATQAAELRARLKEYEDQEEKKVPQKPHPKHTPSPVRKGVCPRCLSTEDESANYCRSCGQALDWGPQMGKIDWDIIDRLTRAFPNGFINGQGEFVAHRTGEYFMLRNCETELDIKCKVLEWFSRAAFKTKPYSSKAKNDEFHAFMLNGINQFLGTRFTEDDMEYIYTYLGNAIKHDKTVEFITEAHYNMGFFRQFEKEA